MLHRSLLPLVIITHRARRVFGGRHTARYTRKSKILNATRENHNRRLFRHVRLVSFCNTWDNVSRIFRSSSCTFLKSANKIVAHTTHDGRSRFTTARSVCPAVANPYRSTMRIVAERPVTINATVSLLPDQRASQLTGITYSTGTATPRGMDRSIQKIPMRNANTDSKRRNRGNGSSETSA